MCARGWETVIRKKSAGCRKVTVEFAFCGSGIHPRGNLNARKDEGQRGVTSPARRNPQLEHACDNNLLW